MNSWDLYFPAVYLLNNISSVNPVRHAPPKIPDLLLLPEIDSRALARAELDIRGRSATGSDFQTLERELDGQLDCAPS